ncbi:Calcium permeable stress-gated cation channel 1 [Ceratocystis lukuohia]|uniref:Calcium permeable stress-gated cation channel 1 n=1 Tax=Ceratocystis lukuohia TaxID=2019550 RepID=A0ABR4MG23_9PEZI
MFFFALTVLLPINSTMFPSGDGVAKSKLQVQTRSLWDESSVDNNGTITQCTDLTHNDHPRVGGAKLQMFTGSYLAFTYFFTFLTLYMVNRHTRRILHIRQDYLGTQSTITDRTFRIAGIPKELKDENRIRQLVEKLNIGNVVSVTLCHNWAPVDKLVADRSKELRELERAWSVLHRKQQDILKAKQEQAVRSTSFSVDQHDLLDVEDVAFGRSLTAEGINLLPPSLSEELYESYRPKLCIWYGPFGLCTRLVDAIDHHEERLRQLDGYILTACEASYDPADLAFVTMDSTTACQMAIQALMDPRPGVLLTNTAPSPSDVVWRNTYASRNQRRLKSWMVTIIISILSVFWLFIVAAVATMLSLCTIKKVFLELGNAIESHTWLGAAVQSGFPVLIVTILNTLVPLLYEFLSYRQGMVSRDDIELSFVSKNFFFTFFNVFFVFTFAGSFSQFLPCLKEALQNITLASQLLAASTLKLSNFYICFVMLQTIGLVLFRLLEPSAVFLYVMSRVKAKSPRDFCEMRRAPQFSYGYCLPTALLAFILCLVYSILLKGYMVLMIGVIYFLASYYVYKYQLIYAMNQPQNATGGAWRVICFRIILSLCIFQVIMAGIIGLQGTWKVTPLLIPLYAITSWYWYYFHRCYVPLTKFIALCSIRDDLINESDDDIINIDNASLSDEDFEAARRAYFRRGTTLEEYHERDAKFINPSLISKLSDPWIYDEPPSGEGSTTQSSGASSPSGGLAVLAPTPNLYSDNDSFRPPALGSSLAFDGQNQGPSPSDSNISLGDTHIW